MYSEKKETSKDMNSYLEIEIYLGNFFGIRKTPTGNLPPIKLLHDKSPPENSHPGNSHLEHFHPCF